jgi:hypothetical protein
MAIQVSYLESKLYPSWFKTGAESVGSFRGNWPSAPSHESVSSFRGDWPTAPSHEAVSSVGEMPTLKAGTVKGFIGGWPRAAKHEEVKSPGLPVTAGDASTDPWLEIGQPYFHLFIEKGADLGYWVKLDGLSMKVDVGEHRTGDGMNYRWIEPTIASFPNIKLSRAATGKGCAQTLRWLMDAQFRWKRGVTAGIEAKPLWHNAAESTWFRISLTDIMPVSWSGPAFATDGKVAMETLELAFSGFLPPEVSPPYPTVPPVNKRPEPPTPPAPPPERTMADLTGGQKAAEGETK